MYSDHVYICRGVCSLIKGHFSTRTPLVSNPKLALGFIKSGWFSETFSPCPQSNKLLNMVIKNFTFEIDIDDKCGFYKYKKSFPSSWVKKNRNMKGKFREICMLQIDYHYWMKTW